MVNNDIYNDLYKILDIKRDATPEEIKQAYRNLSLKYHPDKSGNSENKKYQEILNAYEILSDSNKKNNYDYQYKLKVGKFVAMEQENNNSNINNKIINNNLDNSYVPEIIEKILHLSLEKAYTGGLIPIEIEKNLKYTDNKENKKEIELIYVSVKEGIDNNEIIIIKNKGNCINDIIYGDVKIKIKIIEDEQFLRRGLDLIKIYKISLKEALCGFEFKFYHLNKMEYTIKNDGNQIIREGEQKRIANLGMIRDGFKGDLVIEFKYEYPEFLTEKQREEIFKIL